MNNLFKFNLSPFNRPKQTAIGFSAVITTEYNFKSYKQNLVNIKTDYYAHAAVDAFYLTRKKFNSTPNIATL